MGTGKIKGSLNALARLYNVQTAYYDMHHRRRQVAAESLLGVLQALGAPVASFQDIPAAIRERKQLLKRQFVEPVAVAWNGAQPGIKLCLPDSFDGASIACRLVTEAGENSEWKFNVNDLDMINSADIEGARYITRKINLSVSLPWGYHKLALEIKSTSCETLIISAPQKAYAPAGDNKGWGAFIPLYALRSEKGWGSGDYSALGALADRVAEKGGNLMATLPLLPVFLDDPFEPSPYAPVSRLLWNEFYVDVTNVPELKTCAPAQELAQSASFRKEIELQQNNSMVDYRSIMSLKRRVMEEFCRSLYSSENSRLKEFRQFIEENPLVEKNAAFRSVMEKRHAPWQQWPRPLHDGKISEHDYDENTMRYHMYAQWLAHEQVKRLSEKSRAKGVQTYFDLPLGVHAAGFDVWQHRDAFATNATAGAPPDAVFTGGQNWWFPPLHPENIRAQGYRYVIDYLRHNLQYADVLRVDHVMGLHRLFWIPQGADASRGVYVRYHADELYAILSVESHRQRSVIVGEDLGIVPSYVRKTMANHGLHRMYVLYYELADNPAKALRSIAPHTVASLNTHDMSPFAAFWQQKDIEERLSLGLVDKKGAVKERKERSAVKKSLSAYLKQKQFIKTADTGVRGALKACLAYLSASRARTVLVNLEDLWLETRSQNVPGTGDKFSSWQRKAKYGLEEGFRLQEVTDTLESVNSLRKRKAGKEG